MKKTIITIILFVSLSLNIFAQQEIPMFFDNELGLEGVERGWLSRGAAVSPDGSRIATIFNRKKIVIWDATSGREITRFSGHGNEYTHNIVFSPNGRMLASFHHSALILKIWNTTTGELISSISQSGGTFAFSPDGSRIAGNISGENNIKIWNTSNGNEIRTLVGHSDNISSIYFSPNGRQILTTSYDDTIKIWDSNNGRILRNINNETRIRNAVYSPNGLFIAALNIINRRNLEFAIQIFNAETGQELRSIPMHLNIFDLMYSPDGRHFLISGRIENTNVIKIIDVETGRELRSFNNNDVVITYNSDGRRIFTYNTLELIHEDKYYGNSFVNILDTTNGRNVGVIGYGPLNIGARAFADLQIARFLGDTAAVSRHEAVLQWIIGSGNVTRAQIETFYRNNVRTLIFEVVDAEINKDRTINNDTRRVINTVITTPLADFYLSPTQANFDKLKRNILTLREISLLPNLDVSTVNGLSDLLRYSDLGRLTYDTIVWSQFRIVEIQRLADAYIDMDGNRRTIGQILQRVVNEMKNMQQGIALRELGLTNTNNVDWDKVIWFEPISTVNRDLANKLRSETR